jgi:probable F420-dependent oxidoreductase
LKKMKLDTGITTRDLSEVATEAKRAEELGFDALWSMEAGNDGFLPLALAAEHTYRIKMGPSVAIAFPRSPMTMAYTAWDLAALSKGRFILGLGTQVKGHIERRYGVKWEPPVPKLREYILALKTIFKCWAEGGKKLAFQGKYFNFSLMTPFFAPKPHDYPIPIYIAGVNEHICAWPASIATGCTLIRSPRRNICANTCSRMSRRAFTKRGVRARISQSSRLRS